MFNFPLIRQHDSMQCGVACLAMVCSHYGRDYSLETLSKYCSPTAEGVSLLAVCDAAGKLGLHATAGRTVAGQLDATLLPCILHWRQNHFVVLYRVRGHGGKRRYFIADPAKGLSVYSEDDFLEAWASTGIGGQDGGVALFLKPTPEFYSRPQEGRQQQKRSFRFLLGYIRLYRRYFDQIVLGLLLGCVLQLIMPFLTQAIVDVGIRGQNLRLIWLILLGELMIVLGRTATDLIRRWLLLHISMRINISLVSDFFIKLLRLPMGFFDTKLTGDLMQRIADHSRVQNFLTNQTLSVMFTTLSFLVFGAVLLVYDWKIFGIFLAGSVLYGLWTAAFLGRRKVLDYELFGQQARNQNSTWQMVTSMQEIKLQDCGQRRRWEWEDVQAGLFGVQMKSLRMQQAQEVGSVLINEVRNIVITVLAAAAVIHGQMTLGMMLAVQYIIGQLNSPVTQLMGFIYSLQDVRISLERINEVHQAPDEEGVCGDRREISGKGGITLSGVCFRYDPHSPEPVIDNVSMAIPEGRVTAIVGASGSGKTTLLRLLLGYYRPEAGIIRIGDSPLEEYDIDWWRRQCGVVMQDGVIFSESIARNIAVSDGEIDTRRLEEAARLANIHGYVMSLPLGYNTVIGRDGTGLSQGQRQRILIARAVYRNPRFILLDEATNSLDARNERVIVERLREFFRGRTVVVIAHRLSTVRDADQIIVLDSGRIVETGTHGTLTAGRGAYYTLVKNQLELGN